MVIFPLVALILGFQWLGWFFVAGWIATGLVSLFIQWKWAYDGSWARMGTEFVKSRDRATADLCINEAIMDGDLSGALMLDRLSTDRRKEHARQQDDCHVAEGLFEAVFMSLFFGTMSLLISLCCLTRDHIVARRKSRLIANSTP